jgi:D-arabinose 1-dehydrogenase-like Zn-dependent alcohol dehydrogenase
VEAIAAEGPGASTAAMAKRAGIAHHSIFHQSETKAGLLNAAYLQLKHELRVALPPAAKAVVGGIPGSVTDTRDMLAFAARHGIRPEVETFPNAEVDMALDRVRDRKPR